MNCCSGSGARALYAVWNEMITYVPSLMPMQPGQLRIHLLYNRASKWADIDSHISFVGRVDVKPKQPLMLDIRLPQWVQTADAQCTVDGQNRGLTFDGRYARVGRVAKGQVVSLTFPISERTERVTIVGRDYTLIIRGNDVVSIDPPGKYFALYQRDLFRTGEPTYRRVTRFVSEEEFPWW